ncbi:MAG TPA: PQQ-binding-like beta-propeller repeat protein [Thermoanaerobaculia bacterium]|nr:PQQ-binding-like beta-propeller repeat protein [Thermoanaerobaculia bacterium]
MNAETWHAHHARSSAVERLARSGRALLIAGWVCGALLDAPVAAQPESHAAWPQFGGPGRDFVVRDAPSLAESWPEGGPPVLWRRPLGTGHSTIVVGDGRLYTLYRAGDGRSKGGPWADEERVVALDAATGETLWEHADPSAIQDFSRGAGPHATPLLAGGRLFAIGTSKRLLALDAATGELLWSVDLVADLGAPPLLVRPIVKSGYASSPIAWRDLVICAVGGPGQSLVALRHRDGSVAWKSGHFLISGSSPLLIDVGGAEEAQRQLVYFAGSLVAGLDPGRGSVLWAHAHDAGNDFNLSLPLWSTEHQTLFLSSGYRAGSRGLRLALEGGVTRVEELWFDHRTKFQFLNAVRVGDTVYGTTGESGTAFLTAIDVATGESRWRHRGLGQATLLAADDKLIALTEDGDLVLLRPGAGEVEELARTSLFDTTSWTAPTLVGATLYARDREEIVALDLGARQ